MSIIVSLFVQLILGVLTQGPDALRKLIDIFQQNSVLTPEQADGFRAQLDEAFSSSRWQTDERLAQGGGGASAGGTRAAGGVDTTAGPGASPLPPGGA